MSILVLTQTGGILKPFAIILGFIMNYIYRFLQIFGINNVGLTIILFTLVINVLMIPLTVKQQKFSKMSSLMNPELQKVQKKYQNRKDEKSMRMMPKGSKHRKPGRKPQKNGSFLFFLMIRKKSFPHCLMNLRQMKRRNQDLHMRWTICSL